MKNKKYEMDMTVGPLLPMILLFSLPLIVSSVLQLLFNAADVVVVGRFAGAQALAAVGSTSSLTNLLTNVFIGLSVGTNVVVANFYGAKKSDEVKSAVHTSVTLGIVTGIILVIIGFFFAHPLLSWMGTPEDVIEYSVLYMRIYFIGMPLQMLYNFGSSILKAVGDTKRPLYYLLAAGILNVVLNLIFVIIFGMGVAGVALATVLSQIVSTGLVMRSLMMAEGDIKLKLNALGIDWPMLKRLAAIGLPAGIQGSLFSISNVLIQSSVNSFGSIVMAGNTAAQNIEGFVWVAMNSVGQTAVSFVGQNAGAAKNDRVKKAIIECVLLVTVVGLSLGNLAVLGSRFLVGLYSDDMEVITCGMMRIKVVCTMYCLCGIMDTLVGGLRGLGHAIVPTIISLIGACALRIIYIFTIFQVRHNLTELYLTYPISWFITGLAQMVVLIIFYRKMTNNKLS